MTLELATKIHDAVVDWDESFDQSLEVTVKEGFYEVRCENQ